MPDKIMTPENQIKNGATAPKKAAVIDDAFDDVAEGEITLENFKSFRLVANQNEAFENVLIKLGLENPDPIGWENDSPEFLEFLRLLWNNKEDDDLRPIIDSQYLFADKMAKLAELECLCKNIEGQNIAVERFNSTIDDLTAFQDGEFVYIFIDYNLGVPNGPDAVRHAQKVAKKIYDSCPKESRPVTILMSSDPRVDDGLKEKFQHDASMLEGVFRFSAKSDLVDKSKVSLLVRAYGEEFYSNHILQDYIKSLIEAAKEAQKAFADEVMVLRIEDYEFMQNSILQEQQQPLGDYLGWLYGSYWSNLLLKNGDLREKQKAIDKVISQKAPLHHSIPSQKLSEIFMTALFEQELDEIEYHPWEDIEKSVAKLPYLHLGDVLTKPKQNIVFMILNPQCDLERPDSKKAGQSILLLPGVIDPIANQANANAAKTDFFIFEEKQYRIYWKLREFQTVAYRDFSKWQNDQGLERKFRLRLPFALEIQQRFTSDMSRVGIPVSPPFSRDIAIEVIYKNFENTINRSFVSKGDTYAFLPVTRVTKSDSIRLTLKFALDFKAALVEELKRLADLKQAGDDAHNTPAGLEKFIGKLAKFETDFDDWFFKNRSLQIPAEHKIAPLAPNIVSMILNAQAGINNFPTPFLINIVTRPEVALIVEEPVSDKPLADEGELVLVAVKKPDQIDGIAATEIDVKLRENDGEISEIDESGKPKV